MSTQQEVFDELHDKLGERTTMLRRLAAAADYSLRGEICSDDPFPDRIDQLCEDLKARGATQSEANRLRAERDAAVAEADRLRGVQRTWNCQCCGAFKPQCVCWSTMLTDADGRVRTESCSPEKHGR